MVGEQAAQVLHPQAVGFPVQRLVPEWDISGGDSFEQFADARPAEPSEDAFGALGSAERREQFRCRRFRALGLLDAQQRHEVIPE